MFPGVVSLTLCSGGAVIARHSRGRWTTDRRAKQATVGSTDRQRRAHADRWSETDAQVQRELDRQSRFAVRRTEWREASRCSAGDRRLRGTELSLYPPATVTVWDNTAAQRRFEEEFFFFLEGRKEEGRAACGVVKLRSLDYCIPFQLPIKPMTVKWLLCVTQSKVWSVGFFWMKGSNKTEQQNMLWFSSCTSGSLDNCVLDGSGNGSWKICDSHVFRLQRRWHKTELQSDLSGVFTTLWCDCWMSLKSVYWDQKKKKLRGSWNMSTRPVGLEGYYALLFRRWVHVLVTSSLTLEHPVRAR